VVAAKDAWMSTASPDAPSWNRAAYLLMASMGANDDFLRAEMLVVLYVTLPQSHGGDPRTLLLS
jgi:hypothetical protein